MASILVITGPSEGDYYLLRRHLVVIGRDDGCPIQIVDDLVSRRHIEVKQGDGGDTYQVQDLRSANGTLVNDRPVTGWTSLEDGDIIRIGGTDLMFSAVDFTDGETAFQHFRKRGEHHKSTIIMKESLES